ncbi:ube2m [Symbiodinium sp. KB8]|nr:ube2m [Symbiodinium sp. KB8]
MLWRVVIDMVDQVDMFYYARLAEWVGKEALEKHRPSLVLIQTVVPFLLFFSMVLQAQAFPGVVTDKWPIPVEASATLPQACSEPREEPSRSDAQMQAVSNAQRYALQPQAPLSQLQAAAGSSAPSSVPPRRAEDWQSETSGARQAVTFAADLRGGMPSSGDTFSDRQSSGSGIMLRKSTGFGPGRERAWLERHERARRRRLQAIINLIQRQNVIIARKRSAIASIFLIDIPFLTIRVWLWALLQHTYFPGLGVKNGLCIVLNVMQYTLVALASKESFKRIKRELAEYLCRFQGSALKEEEEEEEEIGHDSPDHNALDEGEVMSPQEPGTPDKQAAKDLPEVLQTSTSQAEMKRALRRVGRESTRSVGACVYICALTMALVLGFVIAQGETVIETFVAWAKEATAVE